MKSVSKIFASMAAAAAIAMSMGITAFAEDFDFDMAKAHWTAGGSPNGAASYTCGTRLSNERRDRHNFDPTWITPETEVLITYEVKESSTSDRILGDGDTIPAPPAELVLQTWVSDITDSTEERMQHVIPSEWSTTQCKFTYSDIVNAWGSEDFSWIYSIQVSDNKVNPLMVTSLMFTNCDIPDEVIAEGVKLGTILENGEEVVIETTAAPVETEAATEDNKTTESADSENADGEETDSTESSITDKPEADKPDAEEQESSGISAGIIAAIAGGVVAVIAAVIVIVKVSASKRKNKGWH